MQNRKNFLKVDTTSTHIPEETPEKHTETMENLNYIVDLLSEKFGLDKYVSARLDINNPEKAHIVLFNGTNGVNEGHDERNIKPIEYLQAFDANTRKEPSAHSYWSNSIVEINAKRLGEVVQGLQLLQNQAEDQPRIFAMARC